MIALLLMLDVLKASLYAQRCIKCDGCEENAVLIKAN